MSDSKKDDSTKKQEKQSAKDNSNDYYAIVTEEEKKNAPTKLKHLLKKTGVPSSRGTEGFHAGAKYAGFIDIPLDAEPGDEAEETEYEMIDVKDTSYGGQQHSSYNSQADHPRKYPPGFGKGQGK